MIYALALALTLQCAVIAFLCVWINRLINKLMSRNYYDYVVTKKVTGEVEGSKTKTPEIHPEDFEDLGYLNSI